MSLYCIEATMFLVSIAVQQCPSACITPPTELVCAISAQSVIHLWWLPIPLQLRLSDRKNKAWTFQFGLHAKMQLLMATELNVVIKPTGTIT
jgi:hypothetical protein